MFLYILIFKFLDSNLEDKRFSQCTQLANNILRYAYIYLRPRDWPWGTPSLL